MDHSPSPTAANRRPTAGSPAPRTPASASSPAGLAIWRLQSPEAGASPTSCASDSAASPQGGAFSFARQHSQWGQAPRNVGGLPADCVSLSGQRAASAAAASDAAAAAAAAASLLARFALQPDSIPEHTVSPPSALPASLLRTHAAEGPSLHHAAAAGLRDSCPAGSSAPRLADGMPLRPVAGSAEWPAGRSGAPRLMLEIPAGPEGRYCDANLLQTPGAGLGAASPAPTLSGYTGGSSTVRLTDMLQ